MKPWVAFVIAVAFGCGNSSSGTDPDGGAGDGDGGGGTDDGGTAGARTVKLTLTNRPMNAAAYSFLVAYQDGSAQWQVAPAPTGDTYAFTINAPSYGVMFACIGSSMGSQTRSVTSAHFAVGERTELTLDVPPRCSDRQQGGVMLSGTVTNRPFTGVLVVQYAGRSAFVSAQNGNFSLQVPTGTADLVVSHAVPQGNGDFYIDEAAVVRNLAVSANTQKSIDFDTAEGTDAFDVDTSAAPGMSRIVASTTLYTKTGTTATLVRQAQGTFDSVDSIALAEQQRLDTDVYDQSIAVSVLGSGVTVTHATNKPDSQTFVAPAPLGAVTTTIPVKQPYITLESSWPKYANAIGYQWTATQQTACAGSNVQCTTLWTAYLSPGVVGAMPAYRMPDLSMLAGWKEAFQLGAATIIGSVTATTSTAGATDFPTGIPTSGTDRVFVRSDYGVQP